VGDELGEVDGSAVEGIGVTSLGLAVGAAFELFEPASAAIVEPSAMGASASIRLERAAERRVDLRALEGADDGSADTDGDKLGLADGSLDTEGDKLGLADG